MTVRVGGPWFEELTVGRVFDAPAITLTAAHGVAHQMLFGDMLRLPLDAVLAEAVTGSAEPPLNPNLVCNVAVGQSTAPSQRVRGNLFYRRLLLLSPVYVGDTLRTATEIVARRQNRTRPGKPATGLVALRVRSENQHGVPVLDFWRCPMLPLRDPEAATGADDDLDAIPAELDPAALAASVPAEWRLDTFQARTPGPHFDDLRAGVTYDLEYGDVVTGAPGLVRMTLNLAATHRDPAASAYDRPLVYGGHTISMAAAHVSRVLPGLVTILAWRSCDHLGPVFEDDVLRSDVTIVGLQPLRERHGLVDLHVRTFACRSGGPLAGESGEEVQVLDWKPVALA